MACGLRMKQLASSSGGKETPPWQTSYFLGQDCAALLTTCHASYVGREGFLRKRNLSLDSPQTAKQICALDKRERMLIVRVAQVNLSPRARKMPGIASGRR